MGSISLILGQAGTGKTTWLMNRAAELAPSSLRCEYQRILAISRMHGARRRLDAKFKEGTSAIRSSVATIDSVALSLVNRWRRSLGFVRPICPVSRDSHFIETHFGMEAYFDDIISQAALLLNSKIVSKIVGDMHPLIIVDEFQDCHGARLDFIKGLACCSDVLLAGDDFQLLDSTSSGCPAIEWVKQLEDRGEARMDELMECHRTSVQGIMRAAHALRNHAKSMVSTIPVICCPQKGPAAYKILDALRFKHWTGTTALLCPTHDPFIEQVLSSLESQLANRNLAPILWHREMKQDLEQQQLMDNLQKNESEHDSVCACIEARIKNYARLRGVQAITSDIISHHADRFIHERRAYGSVVPKRVVTTIHGAKNREYDNVFVLWTHGVKKWDAEQQRRLLYNAVTRAKQNCMVLVWGDEKRALTDPVLSLLGTAQLAFTKKAKAKARTTTKAGR